MHCGITESIADQAGIRSTLYWANNRRLPQKNVAGDGWECPVLATQLDTSVLKGLLINDNYVGFKESIASFAW